MAEISGLLYLRLVLRKGRYGDRERTTLEECLSSVEGREDTVGRLLRNNLRAAKDAAERGDFPRAAAEINLIHNIPLAVGEAWDLAHFLQIELPTYLDEDIDLPRLKQLLSDVGRLVS